MFQINLPPFVHIIGWRTLSGDSFLEFDLAPECTGTRAGSLLRCSLPLFHSVDRSCTVYTLALRNSHWAIALDRFDQVHIVTLLHYWSEPLHNLVDVLNFARNSALVDSSTTKRWTTWSQLVCVWELLPFCVLYYDCLPLMKFATCASTCAFATIYQFC